MAWLASQKWYDDDIRAKHIVLVLVTAVLLLRLGLYRVTYNYILYCPLKCSDNKSTKLADKLLNYGKIFTTQQSANAESLKVVAGKRRFSFNLYGSKSTSEQVSNRPPTIYLYNDLFQKYCVVKLSAKKL